MEPLDDGAAGDSPAALADTLAALERALAEGRAELEALRARHQRALGQLKSERAHATDLAWELEELELRLRDLQSQREGPDDPLLERELASVARRRAEMEELVLAQMIQIDELVTQCAADELALAERERAWAACETRLVAERERVAGLLQDRQRAPGEDK
jgi:methylthioribose-1-phosphate isomerase